MVYRKRAKGPIYLESTICLDFLYEMLTVAHGNRTRGLVIAIPPNHEQGYLYNKPIFITE